MQARQDCDALVIRDVVHGIGEPPQTRSADAGLELLITIRRTAHVRKADVDRSQELSAKSPRFGFVPPECGREVAFSLWPNDEARAFEAGGRVDRANGLRRILVDDQFHLADSPYAERALADLAASYEAEGQRARAAAAYERLARSAVERARSSDALASATRLRLDLGQLDRALRHARSFHRRFSRVAPRRTAAVSVAVADRLALAGRWNEAQRLVALASPAIRSAGCSP